MDTTALGDTLILNDARPISSPIPSVISFSEGPLDALKYDATTGETTMLYATAERQYLHCLNRIVDTGFDIYNKRTGKFCRTLHEPVIFVYDLERHGMSIVTTRKSPIKLAIGEFLGYLKGVTNAQEMADLSAPSWFANANETKAWLTNPNRQGENDMGQVYGHWLHNWPSSTHGTVNQLRKVYENLKQGIDDRGEILLMHNPGEIDKGSLRACMFLHTFSLVDGVLNLTSVQRSWDGPLGGNANMIQCHVFLSLMAQITGHVPGKVTHVVTNAHIYQDQIEIYQTQQRPRTPTNAGKLVINPDIKTLEDVLDWVTPADFSVKGYDPQAPITYPFAT